MIAITTGWEGCPVPPAPKQSDILLTWEGVVGPRLGQGEQAGEAAADSMTCGLRGKVELADG